MYSRLLFAIATVTIFNQAGSQSSTCRDKASWCGISKCTRNIDKQYCPKACGTCKPKECEGCQQTCTLNAQKVYTCSCNPGYKLLSDGKSCQDIDECLRSPCTNNVKNPFCKNLPGSYTCTNGDCSHYKSDNFTKSMTRNGCCKLSQDSCGKYLPYKSGKIVGGVSAEEKAWPWMVHISVIYDLCGGSLLNNQWVVSAAHCFRYVRFWEIRYVRLALGVYNTKTMGSNVVHRTATQIVRHPSYKSHSFTYDIALIKMDSTVTFSDYASPVCFPHGEIPSAGTTCYATGFGRIDAKNLNLPSILQQVKIPIVDGETCKKAYQGMISIDTVRMICAGIPAGGKDTCLGDSGGPLVCQRCDRCSWFLAGITSFGRGCGAANKYGIYTSVEHYETWIASVVKGVVIKKKTCSKIEWSAWASWSGCSSKKTGENTRQRVCKNGTPGLPGCLGNQIERTTCNVV